ncbi:MAG: hypothetical protein N2999_00575 [Proteobacteria bacterium]|nr:hypothetical protein [Pseudomonadota bacterium]
MEKKIQFYLRRLHGITGIFPLGYFLFFHLKEGDSFSSRGLIFSLVFLWIPLLFHSLYGLYITYEGGMNLCCYRHLRNIMYFLQRWSGIFLIIFLGYHIYLMKSMTYSNLPLENFLLFSIVVVSIFHFSNGIFGFLVDYGITVGEKAQSVGVLISFIFFILFGIYGVIKFFNFVG